MGEIDFGIGNRSAPRWGAAFLERSPIKMPSIEDDIEGMLRTLAQIYAMKGSRREVMILARSKAAIEQTEYDNWNGGTYYYAINLNIPTSVFAEIDDFREDIEKDMLRRMVPLLRSYNNQHIAEVRICMEMESDKNWRQNALKWIKEVEIPSLQSVTQDSHYDVFISHASEDKKTLVRPLATALAKHGFRVWYDEFELKLGDGLRSSIDNGLASSAYGIVVLSKAFFAKNWPQYELDGLTARQMVGKKIILPIWHGVERDDILKFSPSLADKLAVSSGQQSVEEMVASVANVINGSSPYNESGEQGVVPNP